VRGPELARVLAVAATCSFRSTSARALQSADLLCERARWFASRAACTSSMGRILARSSRMTSSLRPTSADNTRTCHAVPSQRVTRAGGVNKRPPMAQHLCQWHSTGAGRDLISKFGKRGLQLLVTHPTTLGFVELILERLEGKVLPNRATREM